MDQEEECSEDLEAASSGEAKLEGVSLVAGGLNTCSTVHYSTVQYSIVQYNTVQYSTVRAEHLRRHADVRDVRLGRSGRQRRVDHHLEQLDNWYADLRKLCDCLKFFVG